VESKKTWKCAWLTDAPERGGKHQTEGEASLVLARKPDYESRKSSSHDEKSPEKAQKDTYS
jgi:hypothetical protein